MADDLVGLLTGARDKFVDVMQKGENFAKKHLTRSPFAPKRKMRLQQAGMPAKSAEASTGPKKKTWKSMKHQTKR